MTESYHASTWLVTGASGLVGSAIVKKLCEYEFGVIGLVRKTSDPTLIKELEQIGAKIIYGDILEPELISNYFATIDIIVHTAAIVRTNDVDLYWKINVVGTENLAKLAIEYGVKRFIHISSAGVYDRNSFDQFAENSNLHPQSDYSRSKRRAEEILLDLKDQLDISIIRPPFIFGQNDRYVVPNLLQLFSHKLIPKFWFRDPIIGFVHVEEISNLIVTMGGREKTPKPIYNIQSFEIRYTELVQMVERLTNRNIFIISLPYILIRLFTYPIDLFRKLFNKPRRLASQINRLKYNWSLSTNLLKNDYNWAPLFPDDNELELLFAEYIENEFERVSKDE